MGHGDFVDPIDVHRRIIRFYEYYAPEKVSSVDIALEAYRGREEAMMQALERKYGPEENIAFSSEHRRLGGERPHEEERLAGANADWSFTESGSYDRFGIHASGVRDTTDNLEMEEDSGSADRSLVANHSTGVGVSEALPSTVHFDSIRNRLERIYAYYCPERLASVDITLAAYEGRENVLFRVLEKKYGPEPKAFLAITPKAGGGADLEAGGTRDTGAEAEAEDICSLPFFVPYDMTAALLEAGFARDEVKSTMGAYGPGRERYALSVALIATLIGKEALLDPDRGREIIFPWHQLQLLKRGKPDGMDHFAFEHILVYRSLFLSFLDQRASLIQQRESELRALKQRFSTALSSVTYRHIVVEEACRALPKFEAEERERLCRKEEDSRHALVQEFRRERRRVVEALVEPNHLLGHTQHAGSRKEYLRLLQRQRRESVLGRWEDCVQTRQRPGNVPRFDHAQVIDFPTDGAARVPSGLRLRKAGGTASGHLQGTELSNHGEVLRSPPRPLSQVSDAPRHGPFSSGREVGAGSAPSRVSARARTRGIYGPGATTSVRGQGFGRRAGALVPRGAFSTLIHPSSW